MFPLHVTHGIIHSVNKTTFLIALLFLSITTAAWSDPSPADHADLKFHAAPKPLAVGTVVHDWPSFLGPTRNNISTETNLLAELPVNGPAIVWEVKRGTGYAAPAISKGKLVLFHRLEDNEIVDCLQPETGKKYWRFAYPTGYIDRYGFCNGPRAAPVIAGDFVYIYGAEGKLHCLDLAKGEVKWKHDLMEDFKLTQQFFGMGTTPLVEGDLVIINVGAPKGQKPNGPCVVAYNKITGEKVWTTDDKISNTWGPSYASPIPATIGGKRRVLVFAGGESSPTTGGLLCLDPANGSVDFTVKHRSRTVESVNASSPLIFGNQVFISECYGSGSTLLDVTDLKAPKEIWTNKDVGTHFMTAIHKDGFIYGVDGHGPQDNSIFCLNAKTGELAWQKEFTYEEDVTMNGKTGKRKLPLARCSLLLTADGRFLCLGEYGHLLWLDLSPTGCKELSRSWLFFAGETWTSPVLSRGLLYINQNTHDPMHHVDERLICYDLRK